MKASSGVRVSQSPDGLVILDTRMGQIYTANAWGSTIWSLAEAGRSIDEIVAHISGRTGTPTAQIESDVRAFLGTLRDKGFIVDAAEVP